MRSLLHRLEFVPDLSVSPFSVSLLSLVEGKSDADAEPDAEPEAEPEPGSDRRSRSADCSGPASATMSAVALAAASALASASALAFAPTPAPVPGSEDDGAVAEFNGIVGDGLTMFVFAGSASAVLLLILGEELRCGLSA